ncbi:hypothetical protein C7999DRAFT_36047 [Corynascus novoguineensis]|uniref:Gag protein n=1 Tax=Corynascus novoguineensis TaxID=1126955 RepID=A0AAN7CK56_9PEZI|nr:hypothetical protein C7999DRAFT_36047 [Corynascus novoguineensis]
MANTPGSTVPTGTSDATETAAVALLQRLLASQPSKRQLPLIEKIVHPEDFSVWRDKLLRVLQRHNLDRYVLTDVPQPENYIERQQWLEDRADVEDYLQATRASDLNPKSTFDKLTQYFEEDTLDSQGSMMHELATIRRATFASMDAFQERVSYLRDRLQPEGTPFRLPDEGYMLMTLRGISHEYPDLHHRCMASLENKTLTWTALMREFQRIATTENARPALTTVQIDRKDDRSSANTITTNTSKRKTPYRGTCGICKKSIYRDHKHYKRCDSHILKSVDDCWWCDPEKAPDTWQNKEAARLKKAERQRSTTAPLYQQSGVANAPTSKSPNPAKTDYPKSVLYTTSLLRLPTDMPSFQEGSQRK